MTFSGHFRYDQFGNNLNRYYMNPNATEHPAIFAVQQILGVYARSNRLALYLDLHAHSSKKGCFMYGNVLDSVQYQTQNQLYCRLIALNTPYFDYQSCLFSKKHMFRIEPSDMSKGLSAEGSGRVSTYLLHHLIHSYTLECNYNSGAKFNDVVQLEGKGISSQPFQSAYDKYTPDTFADVGRACLVAWLDLRGHNPASRLIKSKYKTLDRIRSLVIPEIKMKKDYQPMLEADKREIKMDSTWRRCVNSLGGSEVPVPIDNELMPKVDLPIRHAASNDSYLMTKIRSEKTRISGGLLSVTMANLANRGNLRANTMTTKARRSSSATPSSEKRTVSKDCGRMPDINGFTPESKGGLRCDRVREVGEPQLTPSSTKDVTERKSLFPVFIKA